VARANRSGLSSQAEPVAGDRLWNSAPDQTEVSLLCIYRFVLSVLLRNSCLGVRGNSHAARQTQQLTVVPGH
jgi:hypothetical protein